jgi:hypothetical protein
MFLSNAYPLAKPQLRGSWPYEEYFSRDEYRDYVERIRPGYLQATRPAAAVVLGHGRSVWPLHRRAFKVEPESPEVCWDGHLEVYRRSKLILTPFLSNRHINQTRLTEIASLVRDLIPMTSSVPRRDQKQCNG